MIDLFIDDPNQNDCCHVISQTAVQARKVQCLTRGYRVATAFKRFSGLKKNSKII